MYLHARKKHLSPTLLNRKKVKLLSLRTKSEPRPHDANAEQTRNPNFIYRPICSLFSLQMRGWSFVHTVQYSLEHYTIFRWQACSSYLLSLNLVIFVAVVILDGCTPFKFFLPFVFIYAAYSHVPNRRHGSKKFNTAQKEH